MTGYFLSLPCYRLVYIHKNTTKKNIYIETHNIIIKVGVETSSHWLYSIIIIFINFVFFIFLYIHTNESNRNIYREKKNSITINRKKDKKNLCDFVLTDEQKKKQQQQQ